MDTYRAFLAVIISFVILLGYQYFFVGFDQPKQAQVEAPAANTGQQPVAQENTAQISQAPPAAAPTAAIPAAVVPERKGRDIKVETELYTAVFNENGGALKSLVLKKHKETSAKNSLGKELVMNEEAQGFPLKFSWGSAIEQDLFYDSKGQEVAFGSADNKAVLTMEASAGNGLTVVRKYSFDQKSYVIDLAISVKNTSNLPLQGMPQLHQVNTPFEKGASPTDRFLFRGPAVFMNNTLHTLKATEFAKGPVTLQGNMDWVGYVGNYFLRAIVPLEGSGVTYVMQGNETLAQTMVVGNLDTVPPGAEKTYSYKIYYGPKKVEQMRAIGYNLERSVDFGWFDVLARPTLWLLNFLYSYVKNYGIAIILVTVMFKMVFWPISQKGMKSMKNMQKLQPKMAKIKEKYKGDPAKMNQEVMNLYKTYKVNPLGGCLPMVLQIPVFFALYKVLLQSIELRHAPFMLWITDLSAPDRLWLGFDIPYLGGLPVLTLLMGGSMFLQQKLTPTTADPAQAKIMQFLPLIFTFMFLNFASGLVLYWFINNLLSILQQKLINRDTRQKTTGLGEAKGQA
jgi:YidC/Oxa1 family membrane protein insertase